MLRAYSRPGESVIACHVSVGSLRPTLGTTSALTLPPRAYVLVRLNLGGEQEALRLHREADAVQDEPLAQRVTDYLAGMTDRCCQGWWPVPTGTGHCLYRLGWLRATREGTAANSNARMNASA